MEYHTPRYLAGKCAPSATTGNLQRSAASKVEGVRVRVTYADALDANQLASTAREVAAPACVSKANSHVAARIVQNLFNIERFGQHLGHVHGATTPRSLRSNASNARRSKLSLCVLFMWTCIDVVASPSWYGKCCKSVDY